MRLHAKRYKFENNRRIRSKLPSANLQVTCAPASCSLAPQNPSQLYNNRSLINKHCWPLRQSPILIDYGQPLFVWLSRDWPSVRTYSTTDCTGGVGETIKRKGGVSQACLAKSTSFTLDIHNMVNWQLSKQDSHWLVSHDRIEGSWVNSLRWRDLFGSCPLTS